MTLPAINGWTKKGRLDRGQIAIALTRGPTQAPEASPVRQAPLIMINDAVTIVRCSEDQLAVTVSRR